MALSETEQQILKQIEYYEYELPELKKDAQFALVWGAIGTTAGTGIIKLAYIFDETIDNRLGAIPEVLGIYAGSMSIALGVAGVLGALKAGVSYTRHHL